MYIILYCLDWGSGPGRLMPYILDKKSFKNMDDAIKYLDNMGLVVYKDNETIITPDSKGICYYITEVPLDN